MPGKPHILLVHGAWGDASHWRYVIPLLHKKGYRVFGVQNPLTSLPDDIDRTSETARCARCSHAISWSCLRLRRHYGGGPRAKCRRPRLFGRTCSR